MELLTSTLPQLCQVVAGVSVNATAAADLIVKCVDLLKDDDGEFRATPSHPYYARRDDNVIVRSVAEN